MDDCELDSLSDFYSVFVCVCGLGLGLGFGCTLSFLFCLAKWTLSMQCTSHNENRSGKTYEKLFHFEWGQHEDNIATIIEKTKNKEED